MCDDQEGGARACPDYAAARAGRRYPSTCPTQNGRSSSRCCPPGPARGRPSVHGRRAIVNAILYVNRTGCAWRYLPQDFPPWRTVYGYFAAWRDNGALQRIHDRLRDAARVAAGRDTTADRGGDRLPISAGSGHGAEAPRGGTTRRRSTAASATSPWTPPGWSWRSWSPPHPSRTATRPGRCCGTWPAPAPEPAWPGPTLHTQARAAMSAGRSGARRAIELLRPGQGIGGELTWNLAAHGAS